MSSNTKKVIYKILSIYLFSTLTFLIAIFVLVSTWQHEEASENLRQSVREYKRFMINLIHNYPPQNFHEFIDKKAIEVKVTQAGQVVFSNFTSQIPTYAGLRFFQDQTHLYYVNTLQSKEGEIKFTIRVPNKNLEIWQFKKKLLFLLLGILALSTFVAYILIRSIVAPLEENIKKLDDFLKDTTHEIKMPLSVINMSIETLEQTQLSPKNEKRIKNIEFGAKALNNIYENLVQVHFGKTQRTASVLAFHTLLEQRLALFGPLLRKKGIGMVVSIENAYLEIDSFALEKILDNLFSNALKYTKKHTKITLLLHQNSFQITNIPAQPLPKNLDSLFERYTRSEENGGFGIGLNIVKNLCHEANIRIQCQQTCDNRISFSLFWKN